MYERYIKEIRKEFDRAHLYRIVLDTASIAWNKIIGKNKIDLWLRNFDGRFFGDKNIEQTIALWLLSNFTFYTQQDIRALCKELFSQFVHIILKEYKQIDDIGSTIQRVLKNSVFLGLGNESESGQNILYYFRQENNLSKQYFEQTRGVEIDNIICIDDVAISGAQATRYIKNLNFREKKIYFASLLITEQAERKFEERKLAVKVISAMRLSEDDRAFTENSHLFSYEPLKKFALVIKEFCKYYGKIASDEYEDMKGCPLGYDDGQYLIGFEHNTPNNTLPIFWGESNQWNPIFKRYEKKYSEKERVCDENKFY